MGQKRNIQGDKFLVKWDEANIGGINVHNRRDPFDENCSVRPGPFQSLEAILAVRINRSPKQQVGMGRHLGGDKFVRDINLSVIGIEHAIVADDTVEGEHDRLFDKTTSSK